MNDLVVAIPPNPKDRTYDGKAMAALDTRRRQFVLNMLMQGCNPKAQRACAKEAGFDPTYASTLIRDDRVIAAMREESTKRIAGAGLVGINKLIEIACADGHKDQFQAAKTLAGINGFTAEQKIVVEHIGREDKDKIQEIRLLAEKMGLDPRALIEGAGVILDAEFEDVTPKAAVDDSDW